MSVPNRTEVLDDLYTTTWNNRAAIVTDQIFTFSAIYDTLKSKGAIKLNGTGGRYLEVPLSYATNETVTSIGKGDTVSLAETQFMTVAQFEWKFVAGSIVRYFTDDAKNKSVQQHLNWANQKIDNLRNSLTAYFETMFVGDGSGNDSKDFEGLENLVDTTPTTARTVGNIAQTTYTWWQNRLKTASGAASVYLLSDMRNISNTCSDGITRDYPDIIVTTQAISELYDDEVLEQRQIVNQTTGDAEFTKTYWKGIPIVWSAKAVSGKMFFLNSKYIGLNIDPDINFMATAWKTIPNQVEDRVQQIVTKGNLIVSRRKSLGVLNGVA
jgi:hypothetical protein